jgi:SEC-C motif-containing protein
MDRIDTPAELIRARCRALAAGDFATVYDTYHPDSNFRRQFPARQDYLDYAETVLAADFRITECRILRQRSAEGGVNLLLYFAYLYRGSRSELFELALLLRTEAGWRYHSAQKLQRPEFAGAIEAIDWEDFEKVREKVVF